MPEEVVLQPELVAGLWADVLADELAAHFGQAMAEVARRVPAELIAGPPIAIYHRDEVERFDVTLGFAVSSRPDDAGLAVVELPGGRALRVVHRGPYPGLSAAYTELRAGIAERGLDWTYAWERYVVGPGQVADPAEFVTEVLAPLS
jgi:effector-binding domain-containing protein